MLKITFAPSAFLEYMEYQKNNKNLKKINTLLKDIARNGDAGLGKVEKLTGDLSGYYSNLEVSTLYEQIGQMPVNTGSIT